MWHFRHIRHTLMAAVVPGALLAALLLPTALVAQSPANDPVELLRYDLKRELRRTAPNAAKEREKTLASDIAHLKTLSELRRALALTEWQDRSIVPELRGVDFAARAAIGKKFKEAVDKVIKTGNADARLALADMLGEMGTEARSLEPGNLYGLGRALTPELIHLTKDSNPAVRAAAARALGRVFPDPAEAAPAIVAVLKKGSPLERESAAQGLVNLIQVVYALHRTGRAQIGVEPNKKDVIDAARWVVKEAPAGLADSNPRVRTLTLDAILKSLQAFREQIPEPVAEKEFPPHGAKLTEADRKTIRTYQDIVQKDVDAFKPLIEDLVKLGTPLARLVNAPSSRVRLDARKALEAIGQARLRLLRFITSVPTLPNETGVSAPLRPVSQKAPADPVAELAEAVEPGLHIIARGLRDPLVANRLAAVEFLESLEDAAKPAIPVLVEALGDPNRFIRWAAARALGKMGPERTGLVVPAVATLLRDRDVDVAKQAAWTLQVYGDKAVAAVPALAQAAALGDPEVCIAAMTSLSTMSPAVAAPAVPALITAVANRDYDVRKAAAETLGKIGSRAREAVPALRVALRDDNASVRRAASDAILSILAPDAGR